MPIGQGLRTQTVTRAREKGARLTYWRDGKPKVYTRDVAGFCRNPRTRSLAGIEPNGSKPMLDIVTPCRKCPPCLTRRQLVWTKRTMFEYARSSRAWFATFTIRPLQRELFHARAIELALREGKELDEATLFRKKTDLHYREIQLWMKRLRKVTGCDLRFVCVAEAHKDGEPHWHMVLLEQHKDHPVTEEELRWRHKQIEHCEKCEKQCTAPHNKYHRDGLSWPLGDIIDFSVIHRPGTKDFDPQKHNPAYAMKYLSKSMLARVRASLRFGKTISYSSFERQNVILHPPEMTSGLPVQDSPTVSLMTSNVRGRSRVRRTHHAS